MKRLVTLMALALLLISLPLTGCDSLMKAYLVKGSGVLKTRSYDFRDFLNINIDGAFTLEITRAATYNVTVTSDDNMLDNINVSKDGRTLKIDLKKAQYVDTVLKAAITMPQVRSVELANAAKVTLSNFESRASADFKVSRASSLLLKAISVGNANFTVSTTSNVSGEANAGDISFDVTDASTLQLKGTANNILGVARNNGQLRLGDLVVDNADIRLDGKSNCVVNTNGKLDVDLNGTSKVSYFGEPAMGRTKIADGSSITKLSKKDS